MSDREKEILIKDSRSQNMIYRLLQIPAEVRARRQKKWLLATSGCILRCPNG